MTKKQIIALCVAGLIIAALSIWLGFNSIEQNKDFKLPSPSPYTTPVSEQVSTSTVIPEFEEKYKILLNGTSLELYEDGIVIKQTQIAPDVFPRADIKALTEGIAYSSIEKALIDWESLCN